MPGLTPTTSSLPGAAALKRLRELEARPEVSQQQIDSVEKELGLRHVPGDSPKQRVAALVRQLQGVGFDDAKPKGHLQLDGAHGAPATRPGSMASLSNAGAAGGSFAERVEKARTELASFYDATVGQEVQHELPFGQGAVASAGWGELSSGLKVVVRHVDDPELSVSLNNASHLLANQLGLVGSTFAAARGTQQGKNVMFMAHAPAGYTAANKALDRLAKIPEPRRVLGALHDLLSSQDDRFPKNLVINDKGEFGLIDPDWSWGNFNPWGWTPSLFYPEGEGGYTSKQDAFTDLPKSAQETLQKIRSATTKETSATYGLSPQMSQRLKELAQKVFEQGLTRTIAESTRDRGRMYSAWGRNTGEGFKRTFSGTEARVGKNGAAYMSYGPYQPYPKGPVEVDFQLRLKKDVSPDTIVATIDIYDKTTEQPLTTRDVKASDLGQPGSWAHLKLGANLPDRNNMEFRVAWHGKADLDVGWISGVAGQTFHAADRSHQDGFTTAHGITSAREGQQGQGYMAFGPYRPFPVGHALVDFQLRLLKAIDPETPIAEVDIYNKSTEKPLTTRVLRAKDLNAKGDWTQVRLGADLPPGNNMEFRVKWLGKGELDLGAITAQHSA